MANCLSVNLYSSTNVLRKGVRQGKSKGRHTDTSSSAAVSRHENLSTSLSEQRLCGMDVISHAHGKKILTHVHEGHESRIIMCNQDPDN